MEYTASRNSKEIKSLGPQRQTSEGIIISHERDELITGHGMTSFKKSYLLEKETPQLLYARVAAYLGSNPYHAQRLYDYMSKQWFSPATPVLANAGTNRGLPISCYIMNVPDSMRGIAEKWNEQVFLASKGGGVGCHWGDVRSRSEKVGRVGETSGIVPFIKVQESITLAISQGSLRRGNAAVYLNVWHPEIEEFIDIRKPQGGDPERKTLHIHHGVVIDDKFMKAVETNSSYDLISPKDNSVMAQINARDLWIRILTNRLETGEPYIMFSDTVNRAVPDHHKMLDLHVKASNLCTEILLPTGMDHHGNDRTSVCCLSSLNLEKWHEWKDDTRFIYDVMEFLDNVLQEFIETAPPEMASAVYSAKRERSIGLGVMGLHSLFQKMSIPWESAMAKALNMKIFRHINDKACEASEALGLIRGVAPDIKDYVATTGITNNNRFSYKIAIAPTASISVLCGQSSPGIEPLAANAFRIVALGGSYNVKNKYLETLLESLNKNTDEVWLSIIQNKGSVQHLDFLDKNQKDVFKTAMELDQRWIIELAADRVSFIDQGQSINLFLPNNVHKADLHKLHFMAWKKGVKTLYYLRSSTANDVRSLPSKIDMDECLACQ